MSSCYRRILSACSDNDRNPRLTQLSHTFLSLGIRQQGPITHRTTIHYSSHANFNQFLSFRNQCHKIRHTIGRTGCHQGWDTTTEYIQIVWHYFFRKAEHHSERTAILANISGLLPLLKPNVPRPASGMRSRRAHSFACVGNALGQGIHPTRRCSRGTRLNFLVDKSPFRCHTPGQDLFTD